MTFEKNSWKLKRKNFHDWPCPNCSSILVEDAEQRHLVESKKSISFRDHPDWEPDWINGHFSTFLHCNNPKCGELVSVVGIWNPNIFQSDQFDPQGEWIQIDYLIPQFVSPPVNLFQIPQNLPGTVDVHLRRSFSAYWSDKANCLNALRSSLEAALTEQNIPKKFKAKKTGKFFDAKLHQRIERFGNVKSKDIGELLMAVKWLGNHGSHDRSEAAELDQKVIDALTIISSALTEMYDPTKRQAMKLAQKVNKRRG